MTTDAVGVPRIKAATLFSGIGAPEVSCPHWDWLWHAEIEPFPCAVMKARHPGSVNLGDVTAEDFADRAKAMGHIDVLVAGPPCQDFSVAGLRKGISGARGNMTVEFLNIVEKLAPEFVVMENVPGLLSVDGGESFEMVMRRLNEIGYAIEGDVLDAQHHGVPQRRRRIFLLCANVAVGRKRRSPFFAAATGQFLTDCLLSVLAARGRLFPLAENVSVSEKYGADSLQLRMKLFGLWPISSGKKKGHTDIRSFASLLNDWEEAVPPSRNAAASSESPFENSRCPADGTAAGKLSAGDRALTETPRFTSTSMLWSDVWDAVCGVARSFTTSTSTKTTTTQQIFSCAEAALSIVDFTVNSNGSAASLFDEGSSGLTALRGFTNYARWADSDLFARLEGVHDWNGFARRAERAIGEADRHLGDRAHSGEILSVPEGVRRDYPARRQKGEGVAGTIGASLERCSADEGERGNLIAGALGSRAGVPGSGLESEQDFLVSSTSGVAGVAPTLRAGGNNTGGDRPPGTDVDTADSLIVVGAVSAKWSKGTGGPAGDECYNLVAAPEAFKSTGNQGAYSTGDKIDTLTDTNDPNANMVLEPHAFDARQNAVLQYGDKTGPLDSNAFTNAVCIPILEAGARTGKSTSDTRAGIGVGESGDPMFTLQSSKQHAVLAFDTTQITHPENRSKPDDRSPQLSQSGHPPAIANFVEDVSPTIEAVKPPGVVAFQSNAGRDFTCDYDLSPPLRVGSGIGLPSGPAIAIAGLRCGTGGGGDTSDMRPVVIVPDVAQPIRGNNYNNSDPGMESKMHVVTVFKPSHYTRDKDSGPSDLMPPLSADADKGDQDPVLFTGAAVRRLTPVECARLQGFPDHYLDIKFRGKPAADGPKYRALGNSMCTLEVGWILRRIETFEGLK